jgi:ribosome-associated heat shock protein Hsp15
MPNKIRIDKWLWAVRMYKSRSVSTDACKAGKVKVNDKTVKPSFVIEEGMLISINKREKKWLIKATNIIDKRVASVIALTCFEDLSPEQEISENSPAFFYPIPEKRDRGTGRPTKKERRIIDKFKDKDS